MSNVTTGALDGVRVLDCGTFIAGTFAATLMGDLGADVIKVEPLSGDPSREIGPYFRGEGRFFVSMNRNKRGIAIDLADPVGQATMHRLVGGADVVTTNFRPGIAKKLKLDYAALREVNPRVIYSASSGFGTQGPLARRPAFDGILQAMGGIAHNNARLAGKPTHSAVLMVDFTTTLLSLNGILAALHHRESSGVGQEVETSLLQSAMMLQAFSHTHAREVEPEGIGGTYPYRVFETKDSSVFVGSAQNKFWPLLCRAMDLHELADDPTLRDLPERLARTEELNEKLEERFKTRTTAEWEEILADTGVPCGPVLSPDEFREHSQVAAMDQTPVVDHPKIGPVQMYGLPLNMTETPGRVERAAPTLGQHTDEILSECGMTTDEIDELRRDGIVR